MRLSSRMSRLGRNDAGAAAVAMALVSPVVIGGMAIGAETGFWYYTQRKLQHAADVAAHAAGVRKRAGDTQEGMRLAASQIAASSGLPRSGTGAGSTSTNVTVHNPPVSGLLTGRSEAVEVILLESRARMLSSIFSNDPVQISARAVARVMGGSPACVLGLSETKPATVEVSGSSSATLNGCSVAVNSVQQNAYYMPNSSAYLSADCVSTVGGSAVKSTSEDVLNLKVCDSVQENAPVTLDPYASVPEPVPASCRARTTFKNTTVPNASGVECFEGLTLSGTVKFSPGLYIINEGELSITGGTIQGEGVTFFFTKNATAKLAGNPLITLSAPTTGPYAGLLFFGARCDLEPTTCEEVFTVTGDNGSSIQGAIYLPGSAINFLGNSEASSSCLQIIADKITFTGHSTITMGAACDTAGTKPVLVGQVVKLVE
jgi:Flp pilus assembly protein TadG